jgi:phosphopantothenoylcysteine decarboxylase/phosphopantothenate--cysteine ligase
VENPDILSARAGAGARRPRLVVGFAAETEPDRDRLAAAAEAKRAAKGCDWIVANDVSPGTGTFGGETNAVHLVTAAGHESWPPAAKAAVADRLAGRIAAHLTAEAPAA